MSAFLVGHACIDRIINGLRQHSVAQHHEFRDLKLNLEMHEDATKFGRMLLRMNWAGLRARYGDKPERIDYVFVKRETPISVADAYKAMRCLIYQCSEGAVPESKLFKQVGRLGAALCEVYVSSLPEYNAASWG